MRNTFLIVALLVVSALTVPALASHGAYVRVDSITAISVPYTSGPAHRFLIDLNAGDRLDVSVTSLGASRSLYAFGGDAVPHDLGLSLFMPGGAVGGLLNSVCPTGGDALLSGEATKTRSAVATSTGEATLYVKADVIAPAGNIDYRLNIAVNTHQGAGLVDFYGEVSYTQFDGPLCNVLATIP